MNSIEDKTTPLQDQLIALRSAIAIQSKSILEQYSNTPFELQDNLSAINLSHYLALRRHDIRIPQWALAKAGASSLGLCEPHVMTTLNQVISLLQCGHHPDKEEVEPLNFPSFSYGNEKLLENSERLFGPKEQPRQTRIMVTLPTKAAWDSSMIYQLIENGMNCARINCAHDDPDMWKGMINNIIKARSGLNRNCTILMDLAGQKIRTELGSDANQQLKLKPRQQAHHSEPAQLLLGCNDELANMPQIEGVQGYLGLPEEIYSALKTGDFFTFKDANGKKRKLIISARNQYGNWIAQCHEKCLITPDITYKWCRKLMVGKQSLGKFEVSYFPKEQSAIELFDNDQLLLTRTDIKQSEPILDEDENIIHQVGCTQPAVLDNINPGECVWFDDGKIGAKVEKMDDLGAWLRITHISPEGCKLRADKGINFPDSHLDLPALTEKDLSDLNFIAKHADMVGFSFVQNRNDMLQLMNELERRDAKHLAIIAKIETKVAVHNLPEILLAAINDYRLGVMIARGDLAIELGGERMAEIQEELLWLCEAAHVPVIWATQVLENLAKNGISTRAELTDAAMSNRAECVMLNKGKYILQALQTLNSILNRMQDHQYKKFSRMRALHW